jgi:hypothetical protein
MEDYKLEDVLEECRILAAQNKTAKKKRERGYLDKRNYLIGLLHYKYGKRSQYIGDLFNIDDSTVRASKAHAYNLLSYNDITFTANACEFIQRFPYEFPSSANKLRRGTTVVLSLDIKMYKKIKAYGDIMGDDKISTTIKTLLKKSMKLWEE